MESESKIIDIEIIAINQLKKRKTNTSEYNRQYYQKNKTHILANVLEKVPCPCCGHMSVRCHLKRHMKSKLCKKRTAIN